MCIKKGEVVTKVINCMLLHIFSGGRGHSFSSIDNCVNSSTKSALKLTRRASSGRSTVLSNVGAENKGSTRNLRTQLDQYVRCIFYSEKLNEQTRIKLTRKLACEGNIGQYIGYNLST